MVSGFSLALAGLLFSLPLALAGFSASSTSNIAVYWGQNSVNLAASQQRLSYYCTNNDIDIILIAFLLGIKTLNVNFANAGDNCTAYSDGLLDCPQIEEDIITCQAQGKTIMLSIGGSTYSEGGFSSSSDAVIFANTVWEMFGPESNSSGVERPFGSAVVDGFDFDFESTVTNMEPFAAQLRSNMDAATDKTYYLSAAPQCPYPDLADNDMLNGAISFDFINVQFYNNPCGAYYYVDGAATQTAFNFDTWDTWARNTSKTPDVKVLLGIPAYTSAAGSVYYVSGTQLAQVILYSKTFSSFGGVMMWDMSQLFYNNPTYLAEVVSDLGASGGTGTTTTSGVATTTPVSTVTTTTMSTSTTTTTTTSSGSSTTTGVAQWGQCGGEGYTGPTDCAPPYKCVETSKWWSDCR